MNDIIQILKLVITIFADKSIRSSKRKKVFNENSSQDEIMKEVSIRLSDVNDL
jgi:hypothetical protein